MGTMGRLAVSSSRVGYRSLGQQGSGTYETTGKVKAMLSTLYLVLGVIEQTASSEKSLHSNNASKTNIVYIRNAYADTSVSEGTDRGYRIRCIHLYITKNPTNKPSDRSLKEKMKNASSLFSSCNPSETLGEASSRTTVVPTFPIIRVPTLDGNPSGFQLV